MPCCEIVVWSGAACSKYFLFLLHRNGIEIMVLGKAEKIKNQTIFKLLNVSKI